MRVVGGEWGGRRLTAPAEGTRPTLDRVRQILFDILGPSVAEGPFLDLYAGSGALGLEALSRGAPAASFVEISGKARSILARNIAALGAGERATVLGFPVQSALPRLAAQGARFRHVFADPPYDSNEGLLTLQWLGGGAELLLPDSRVILETRRGSDFPERCGRLWRDRERPAGGTTLLFYRRTED